VPGPAGVMSKPGLLGWRKQAGHAERRACGCGLARHARPCPQAGLIVAGACDAGGARYWNLSGGGVEPGETLQDCLIREGMARHHGQERVFSNQ
jgi:hypothetical protein